MTQQEWKVEIWRNTRVVLETFYSESRAREYAVDWIHSGNKGLVKIIHPDNYEETLN